MTTIVTRAGKGSPLTHTEVDTNFTNLNTAKLETAAIPLGTLGAPSISFLSYSTTGIYSPAGDELGVSMLGSDKIRIKSTGEIIINATASRTTLSTIPKLQIEGNASPNQCSMSLTGAGAGGTLFPRLHLSKARSSVNAIVLEDDILGFISFNGGDGSSLVNAGFIKAEVDGTPSAGIVPGRLVFATVDTAGGSGERMIIKNNGNVSIDGTTFNVDAVNNRVGIGTTSPSVPLHVLTSTTNTPGLFEHSGSVDSYLYLKNSTGGAYVASRTNDLSFHTAAAATERARIDSSGRLLIGTTNNDSNFDSKFQIAAGDATASSLLTRFSADAGGPAIYFGKSRSATVGTKSLVDDGDTLGGLEFYGSGAANWQLSAKIEAQVDGTPESGGDTSDMPGRLVFSTTADGAASPTERMRINSSGRLDAWGGSAINSFNLVTQAAAGTTYYLIYGGYSSSGVGNYGTQSFGVWSNGNVINTNNSYTGISDIKLKENIVDANSQWDDLKALQVRNFNFKEGQTHTQIGLVAQEVEEVSPGLVSQSPDRDAEGNDLGTVTKSVNYSVLYMKAVKALQEAMERIEQLEAEMAAVKSQLS